LAAYNKAMEQMVQRYPDDYEVQVFYALTLQASASKAEMTYANQLKSVAILEKLYDQNPQHPGVTHLIIHAYDFAPLAERGVPAPLGATPASPRRCRTPATCHRTSTRWSGCGRNPSRRTLRRSRSNPTTITRRISRCMRTCSSSRTPRPRR